MCLQENLESKASLSNDLLLDIAVKSKPMDAKELLKPLFRKETSIIAWDLNELRPTYVLFKYVFVLLDKTSVRFHLRKMPAKYNKIVRMKIDAMLAVGIKNQQSHQVAFLS